MLLFVLQRANLLTKDCRNVKKGTQNGRREQMSNILPENISIISVSSLIFTDKICQVLSSESFGFGRKIGFAAALHFCVFSVMQKFLGEF
jgi:hypothetical protein